MEKTSDYYTAVSFIAAVFTAIIVSFANNPAFGIATFATLTSINCSVIAAGYIARERTSIASVAERNDKKG